MIFRKPFEKPIYLVLFCFMTNYMTLIFMSNYRQPCQPNVVYVDNRGHVQEPIKTLPHKKSYLTNETFYISFLTGDWRRFGNLMFNYAAMIGIAESNNMIPLIKRDSQETELLDVFEITSANCTKDYFLPGAVGALIDVYNHNEVVPLIYDERTESLPRRNIQLIGSYESRKYFQSQGAMNKLRKEFKFKSNILNRAESVLSRLKDKMIKRISCVESDIVVVGIHARRGDMASPELRRQGFTPPGASYFFRAMAHMYGLIPPNKPILFVISSDNLPWCRQFLSKHVVNGTNLNIDFTATADYVVDMAVLSLSDHIIISAGSYGWWSAWLVNGITIYYKDWPNTRSKLRKHFSAVDYYYPGWIPL